MFNSRAYLRYNGGGYLGGGFRPKESFQNDKAFLEVMDEYQAKGGLSAAEAVDWVYQRFKAQDMSLTPAERTAARNRIKVYRTALAAARKSKEELNTIKAQLSLVRKVATGSLWRNAARMAFETPDMKDIYPAWKEIPWEQGISLAAYKRSQPRVAKGRYFGPGKASYASRLINLAPADIQGLAARTIKRRELRDAYYAPAARSARKARRKEAMRKAFKTGILDYKQYLAENPAPIIYEALIDAGVPAGQAADAAADAADRMEEENNYGPSISSSSSAAVADEIVEPPPKRTPLTLLRKNP